MTEWLLREQKYMNNSVQKAMKQYQIRGVEISEMRVKVCTHVMQLESITPLHYR